MMTMRRLVIAATLASASLTTAFLTSAAFAAAPPAKGAVKDGAAPATTTAPAAEQPPNLREVASHVQWYRGLYSREATGFQFMVPATYHLAENNDARNLEMATGHPDDPDVVAWIVALNQPVTNPQTWVVRVRWRGDGVIAATPADLEAKQLEAARARPAEKRLASSEGTFKRFVDEPELIGHVVDWVEERTPASGKGSVFDCHAVRLARRGILEFSIIGVNEAVAKTCAATLQGFTEKLTFDEAHEYPDQAGSNPKAPYSLAGLVTQTK
jgi:hypothetical protein